MVSRLRRSTPKPRAIVRVAHKSGLRPDTPAIDLRWPSQWDAAHPMQPTSSRPLSRRNAALVGQRRRVAATAGNPFALNL